MTEQPAYKLSEIKDGEMKEVQVGETPLLLLPVAGIFHHPGQASLHPGFFLLDTPVGVQRGMQLASGCGGKGGNT